MVAIHRHGSLVPKPLPLELFCYIQYRNTGRAWNKISHEHGMIDKWQQKGGVSCVAKQVHVYHLVCMTVTLTG